LRQIHIGLYPRGFKEEEVLQQESERVVQQGKKGLENVKWTNGDRAPVSISGVVR